MSDLNAWVAGEALIDLLLLDGRMVPTVGGGAANTARALANLGVEVSLIGGISQDDYGELILDELVRVDLSKARKSSLPTATALVSLDSSGSANYDFKFEGTATFDFDRDWLPTGSPKVLHVGTLATVIQPGADELFLWAKSLGVPLIFDPNIRPSVLPDAMRYREEVEKWASISSIVKLSEDDLNWLGYESLSKFFSLGASLVVLTAGESGLTGHTSSGQVFVPAVSVEVADTVGAGDTVGAVLVEGLIKFGLESLISDKLFEILSRAAKAAAITCTRAGAKPPTLSELEA